MFEQVKLVRTRTLTNFFDDALNFLFVLGKILAINVKVNLLCVLFWPCMSFNPTKTTPGCLLCKFYQSFLAYIITACVLIYVSTYYFHLNKMLMIKQKFNKSKKLELP